MNNTPFLKLREAAEVTGLSVFFLRSHCKDGSIPHVKSGSTYYVDVPALLDKLRSQQQEVK